MSEKNFSARLSRALKASGLSQAAVAKNAGITAPYLSDLKKGKRGNPSADVVQKLADALSIAPAWLMSYTDQTNPSTASQVPPPGSQNAENFANPNESESASPTFLQDAPAQYVAINYREVFRHLAESADLDWLQSRIRQLSEKAATGDITAGQTVAALAPLVNQRMQEIEKAREQNHPPPTES